MQAKIYELFCCMRPSPAVTFQHTRVEFAHQYAYVDVFCYVERAEISDQDYLCVNRHSDDSKNMKR